MRAQIFRITSKEGDIVRMPNGMRGTIDEVAIVCGGHVKRIHVRPHIGWFGRLWMTVTGRTYYYEEEIDKLTHLS